MITLLFQSALSSFADLFPGETPDATYNSSITINSYQLQKHYIHSCIFQNFNDKAIHIQPSGSGKTGFEKVEFHQCQGGNNVDKGGVIFINGGQIKMKAVCSSKSNIKENAGENSGVFLFVEGSQTFDHEYTDFSVSNTQASSGSGSTIYVIGHTITLAHNNMSNNQATKIPTFHVKASPTMKFCTFADNNALLNQVSRYDGIDGEFKLINYVGNNFADSSNGGNQGCIIYMCNTNSVWKDCVILDNKWQSNNNPHLFIGTGNNAVLIRTYVPTGSILGSATVESGRENSETLVLLHAALGNCLAVETNDLSEATEYPEAPEETSEEETSFDSSSDVGEESSSEIHEETSSEIHEESSSEIHEETSSEIHEETTSEIQEETSSEINEETSSEIVISSEEAKTPNEASESQSEAEEDTSDVGSSSAQEETSPSDDTNTLESEDEGADQKDSDLDTGRNSFQWYYAVIAAAAFLTVKKIRGPKLEKAVEVNADNDAAVEERIQMEDMEDDPYEHDFNSSDGAADVL